LKKRQRKSYTTAFKVKIALEAIKGQRTINEIATHYGVHPNLVTKWKKQAIESLPDVFSTRRERDAEGEAAHKAELYQQIGQLKVELDWLKKKLVCSIDRKRQMIEPDNKIGLDVVLEALREDRRERRATLDEIEHYAEICRVTNVMGPYLEAIW
jgi:transposase-like protein